MLSNISVIFYMYMKLAQYNECLISIEGTDGLVV